MEYLIFSLVGFAAALALVYFSKLLSKRFVIALALAIAFQLVFDNLAVSQGFWLFPLEFRSGILVGLIPVENIIFGAALFSLSVLVWERRKWISRLEGIH